MKQKLYILLTLLSCTLLAQDKKYFDAPFGGGGGYTPGWHIPNIDAVNDQVKAFGLTELTTNGFYTSGGAGFIYIGFVPGLRVGGMGYGGSTSESTVQNGFSKEIIYSLGGGGLTAEYSLPFIKNIGVSIGIAFGSGSLEIEIYKMRIGYTWNEIWDYQARGRVPPEGAEVASSIQNSFWFISPTLNIDIPLYRFVSFRIGGGYQLAFGEAWTYDNNLELADVPQGLNGNSFFIQSGIFFGFFSY